MKEAADYYVGLWCYAASLPFHAFSYSEFDLACEAIGRYGPGYKGPTEYQLRVTILQKAYTKCQDELKKTEVAWDEYGCSILTDGWTDRLHRSIMNLCVHCKDGTSFIKSIDASQEAHTWPYIYEWVEKCIQKIGEDRVIQVVTDNASSNMMARDMMKLTRPKIFWSSCVTHTITCILSLISVLGFFLITRLNETQNKIIESR